VGLARAREQLWRGPAQGTDARLYLNQFGIPAVAYGPRARNIHAADESVELASIVAGARTLARFLAGYYAAGGLRTGGAS
jgi:acetylornithine deacetylase